jgi:PilZ domain
MASQRFTRIGVALRRSARERQEQLVRLDFDDGSPSISGVLSDLSATGARLSVIAPKQLAERFTLHFPDATNRRCRLVWRSFKSIGVEFVA